MRSFALVLGSLALLGGLGCASTSPAPASPPTPAQAYPRGTAYAAKLWRLLEATNLPRARVGEDVSITAFDLECTLGEASPTELWPPRCRFRKRPGGPVLPLETSPETRTALLSTLFELPVSQGDSGAATPYLHCRRRGDWTTCDVATQVDYEGS
jgi:hypothetical protein